MTHGKGARPRVQVTLGQVAQLLHLPITSAADALGVCVALLKRKCRQLGLTRWPHRQVKALSTKLSLRPGPGRALPQQLQRELDSLRQFRETQLAAIPSTSIDGLIYRHSPMPSSPPMPARSLDPARSAGQDFLPPPRMPNGPYSAFTFSGPVGGSAPSHPIDFRGAPLAVLPPTLSGTAADGFAHLRNASRAAMLPPGMLHLGDAAAAAAAAAAGTAPAPPPVLAGSGSNPLQAAMPSAGFGAEAKTAPARSLTDQQETDLLIARFLQFEAVVASRPAPYPVHGRRFPGSAL
jgi:hypothetical protein